MYTCCSHLENQDAFYIITRFDTKVFDTCMIFFTKVIKTQTVFFGIHNFAEFVLKHFTLRRIDKTFKNRILNALAVVDALLRNLTQSFSTGSIFRIYIISDKYHHMQASFP